MKLAHCKLDIIHSDVCGPLPTGIGGKHYSITFIDDHSQHVWIHFLQHKSEALADFKELKIMVENQTGLTIKVFVRGHPLKLIPITKSDIPTPASTPSFYIPPHHRQIQEESQ